MFHRFGGIDLLGKSSYLSSAIEGAEIQSEERIQF